MEWDSQEKAAIKKAAPSAAKPAASASSLRSRGGRLQDRVGNRGLAMLLRAQPAAAAVQAKLAISQPGDRHELEADRAADAAMSGAGARPVALTAWAPGVQRACSSCEEEDMALQRRAHGSADSEDEELLQAKAEGGASSGGGIEGRLSSRRGGGAPLTAAARSFFEPRFGRDFGGVRVHTDGAASDLNRQVRAHAFTRGNDIFFAAGRFDPGSERGRHLLAHELAHTVQQQGGGAAPLQRDVDDATPMGGMRSVMTASCPGSKDNKVYLTNEFTTYAGVGNPLNAGHTALRLMCYDADGNSIPGSSKPLNPGESLDWYLPVEGTARIGFFCESGSGVAKLSYDKPFA